MRKNVIALGPDLYPSGYSIRQSKKACLPLSYTVTEVSAEISVQEVLDHWVYRLSLAEKSIFRNQRNLNLICKWGCDGSSGHSTYKQKFQLHESSDELFHYFLFHLCQ